MILTQVLVHKDYPEKRMIATIAEDIIATDCRIFTQHTDTDTLSPVSPPTKQWHPPNAKQIVKSELVNMY